MEVSTIIQTKETILRKSKYQQKVLKFKKTSPFPQNLFIDGRFLNESTPHWQLFQLQKDFTVKGYENY